MSASACSSCGDDRPPSEGESEAEPEPTASAAPTAVSTAPTGVEACDAYIDAAARCLEEQQAEDPESLRESIDQYRAQSAEAKTAAAKQSLSIGCEVALSSLREEHDCAADE